MLDNRGAGFLILNKSSNEILVLKDQKNQATRTTGVCQEVKLMMKIMTY